MMYYTTGLSSNYENGLHYYPQMTTATAAGLSLASGEHRTLSGRERFYLPGAVCQEQTAIGLGVTPSGNPGPRHTVLPTQNDSIYNLPVLASSLTGRRSTSEQQEVV